MKQKRFTQPLYVWADDDMKSVVASNFLDWCRDHGYNPEKKVGRRRFLKYKKEYLADKKPQNI